MATPNETLLANGLNALQVATKNRAAGLDTAVGNAKSRANHTGTQPSTTISDFAAAVDTRVSAVTTPIKSTAVTALAAGASPTIGISNGVLTLGMPPIPTSTGGGGGSTTMDLPAVDLTV